MDARRVGRRSVVVWAGAALAAVMPLARAAAEDSTKDKVLKGCRDSGNSAIDKPDGSYQCNLKDGGEIKCDTKDQCIYQPPRKIASLHGGLANLADVVGTFEVVSTPATHANPLTTAGTVIEAQDLGITLVVAESLPMRSRQGKRRRRR